MGYFDRYKKIGEVDGSAEASSAKEGGDVIPGGTKAIANLEDLKWEEHEETGYRKVKATWSLLEGDFEARKVFQNIDLNNEDKDGELTEKALRAANMLMRILHMAGVTPDDEMSDEVLAECCDLVAGITIDFYEMMGDGGYMAGNWVRAIDPSKGFESITGKKQPKGEEWFLEKESKGGGRSGGKSGGRQRGLDLDDDEPKKESTKKKESSDDEGESKGKSTRGGW